MRWLPHRRRPIPEAIYIRFLVYIIVIYQEIAAAEPINEAIFPIRHHYFIFYYQQQIKASTLSILIIYLSFQKQNLVHFQAVLIHIIRFYSRHMSSEHQLSSLLTVDIASKICFTVLQHNLCLTSRPPTREEIDRNEKKNSLLK